MDQQMTPLLKAIHRHRIAGHNASVITDQEPETVDPSSFVCSFLPNNGPIMLNTSPYPKQPEESQVNKPNMELEEESLGNTNSNPQPQPNQFAFIAIKQVRKLNSMLELLGLVPQSSNTKFVCSKEDDGEVMFIEIIRDDDEPQNEDPNEGEWATTEEPVVEYFDTFPTRDELTYHRRALDVLRTSFNSDSGGRVKLGIRNVSPNGVFGNEVYGGDSKGFGVNPSSDEFRLCNSDEWRSINGGGPL
ncbi:hypothetical protein Tco_1264816 [Tanacetum coccineum]